MITRVTEANSAAAVAAMTRLEQQLFGTGAWSEQAVINELHAPYRTYMVSTTDHDDVNGYAGFFSNGEDAEIMTIGVDTAYQRQGLGRQLLNALVDEARAQGLHRMLLEVRADNAPARALYDSFGFTPMGVRKHYYQPDDVDAITMSYEIEPRIVGFTSSHANENHTGEERA